MVYNVEIFFGVKVGEKEFEAKNKNELRKMLKGKYAVGCTFKITRKE